MNTLGVLKTCKEVAPLPIYASKIFRVLHQVHKYYSQSSLCSEVTKSSGNAVEFFSGVGLKWAVGDKPAAVPLRFAAHTIQFTRRVVDCMKQQQRLQKAYTDWNRACLCKDVVVIDTKLPKLITKTSFISLNFWIGNGNTFYLQVKVRLVAGRVSHITRCTFFLIQESLLMSHHLMLVCEATSMTRKNNDKAMDCLFLNLSYLLDEISENREELITNLYEEEEMMNHLLSHFKSEWEAKPLIQATEKALELAEKGKNAMDSASKVVAEETLEVGKALARTAFSLSPFTPFQSLLNKGDPYHKPPKKNCKKTRKWLTSLELNLDPPNPPQTVKEIQTWAQAQRSL